MTFQGIIVYLKKNYLIAISGGVVLLCAVVHYVRNEQITRLAADYDDLSIRRSRMLKNFRFATNIEEDLEVVKETEKEAEARLFHPGDLASNQRYFYQVESSSGVTISSLQQIIKPLPTGKKSKKARKLAANSKYRGILYDMNVVGTYEEIISFLRELEGGDAFAVMDGFSLAQSAGDRGSLVNMRLSVEVLGTKS